MKKVCHLTSVHPRYDTRIFVKECGSLAKNGYEVSLVVADGKGGETKNNIKIFDVGKQHSRIKRIIKTPNLVLKKALNIDAEIYHFHDPELLKIGIKLIKKGKKVIYDVHEDVPRQILSKPYIKQFLRPFISKTFEKYENKKASKFSFIVTATDFIENRFLKINKNSKAIKNYPIISELKIDIDWRQKENKVCYIGAFSEVRGIKEIVKAMEKSTYRLNLAGIFASEDFKKQIQNLKSWDKADYHGFVDRNEVKSILSKSKAGLVTLYPTVNYKDALPVKMFEYMLAGIPVISSDIPLWKEIVENENCGICVNPYNPKEIAEAIDKLIENDQLAQELGNNGKKAVEEKYNWKTQELDLIKIYNELI